MHRDRLNFLSPRKVETRFLGQSQKESKLLNNEEITATCCDINYSPTCWGITGDKLFFLILELL